jgi:hypothetical protein
MTAGLRLAQACGIARRIAATLGRDAYDAARSPNVQLRIRRRLGLIVIQAQNDKAEVRNRRPSNHWALSDFKLCNAARGQTLH